MNIFSYGRVYSKLSPKQIASLNLSGNVNINLLSLSRIYFFLFGYPDVASQQRFLIVEKLLKLKKGEKIIDAGCGNGIYLQEFGAKYDTYGFGVDIRGNRISEAKKINKYLGRKDEFIKSALEKLKLGKKKFDKAICLEVLEHIEKDSDALKRISRNLKKGSLFVLSIPIIGTALTAEQENDPDFVPEEHGHVRSGYDEKGIKVLAKNSGLKIVSIEKYFFLISRYMVKFQQFLFNKEFVFLNLLLSPILLIISRLDSLIRIKPRGYMIVLKKT